MRRGWQPPKLDDSTNSKSWGRQTSEGSEQGKKLQEEWPARTPVMECQPPTLIAADLYCGSMADGADALWRGNPLGVKAVVNCAQEDWMHQVRKGRCGKEAAVFTTELREAFDKLAEAPQGDAQCGTVMGVNYMGFSAKDEKSSAPAKTTYAVGIHFPASIAFVGEHLGRGEKVLVHCLRGENRSAAVCAAFLIKERGMACEEAIALLREKRGDNALSNEGFVDELRALGNCRAPSVPVTPATEPPPTPAKPPAPAETEPTALPEEDAGDTSAPHQARRSTACLVL